ncbi:MAG: hypothetical protein DI637_01500 [Citromicrobium sp.]|nr:MAG: hypothetical protein DI637_01500 [Citromicrobium sp.]
MQNDTITEATIAMSDSAGPGSFAGNDWLVAVNLGFSTALFLIAALFCADLIKRLWLNRDKDRLDHPVTVFRVICSEQVSA